MSRSRSPPGRQPTIIMHTPRSRSRSRSPYQYASQVGTQPPIIVRCSRSRSRSPAAYRIHRTRSQNRSRTPSPTGENKDAEGKVVDNGTHVLRWQIWNQKDQRWAPFDPDMIRAPPPKFYPNAFFIVNVRYKNEYAEPEYVLSDLSERLLGFLRGTAGGVFFQSKPKSPVQNLFLKMKQMRLKHAKVKDYLDSREYDDLDVKVKEVASLGFTEATKPSTTWIQCKAFLAELLEQLDVFMPYMDEHFAPTEERLARLKEYGQMDFDLLEYHFESGQHVVGFDRLGRPEAFVLSSCSLESTYRGRMVALYGTAYTFNGDTFAMSTVNKVIDEFSGTRPIDQLDVRILPEEVKEALTERGRLYSSLAGVQHKLYDGQRVILDPKAYQNRDGYIKDPKATIIPLEEESLFLLPPDMEGFNLATKLWEKFDVTLIREVVYDEEAWEHLVLDADTKMLLESLVRVSVNANTSASIISDVISGKGGGLLSVLHGPPGTGKTLTAEAIAEHLHRPLYMVGFTELSTSGSQLESSLRPILSLATAWDAVLLIDEADVFLEQRSLHELERNAMVSVALRLLEYHRGVLFLTTNRIKAFDEAFMSRFSVAIRYPELDRAGRCSVWRKFFDLAGCRLEGSEMEGDAEEGFTKVGGPVSNDDIEELAENPFNGRTIKNLVRTAQALALSQQRPMSADHVKTVVRVQEKFLREFA